jgi:hypothetical protein
MQAKSALSVLVLAAGFAGSAFAEGPIYPNDPFVATKSRAEVQADLFAYQRAGVNPWAQDYNPLHQFASSTTRQAVTAQYIASRDEVKALNGEDSGSVYLAQARSRNAPVTVIAGRPVSE